MYTIQMNLSEGKLFFYTQVIIEPKRNQFRMSEFEWKLEKCVDVISCIEEVSYESSFLE